MSLLLPSLRYIDIPIFGGGRPPYPQLQHPPLPVCNDSKKQACQKFQWIVSTEVMVLKKYFPARSTRLAKKSVLDH